MVDLVVTCPKGFWADWIAEGDAAGGPESGEEWAWYGSGLIPPIGWPGDRLYVVAHDRLRGYAPVTRLELGPLKPRNRPNGRDGRSWMICRRGGAVAVTLSEPVRGFQGWRHRWWPREAELPFPDWRTP
ncbi:MAG TPA: hypothetical protein VGS12_13490 [Caulobacteraceae bacterium]|nr:hypothetical protein [Caulobacteraceae bacterium]